MGIKTTSSDCDSSSLHHSLCLTSIETFKVKQGVWSKSNRNERGLSEAQTKMTRCPSKKGGDLSSLSEGYTEMVESVYSFQIKDIF